MLKQITPILLLSLSLVSPCQGHFLWRVDTEKPSYLYGTVHSSAPEVNELPEEVVEALRISASFHPELEFSPENIGRLTAAIFASGPADLKEELPAPLWDRLVRATESAGIPAALLQRIPVQLIPLLLSAPPGTEFNKIVDVQLYQIAREQGLDVQQLESVDEQMAVFRNLSRDEAIVFLKDALTEWEKGFPTQEKILRFYRTGDLEALKTFLDDEVARLNLPDLAQNLIEKRNHKMAERLLPFLQDGGAFAAVGVAHMPGEDGIVALLQKKGYKITRLPLSVEARR